jgi:hypothetical protein
MASGKMTQQKKRREILWESLIFRSVCLVFMGLLIDQYLDARLTKAPLFARIISSCLALAVSAKLAVFHL